MTRILHCRFLLINDCLICTLNFIRICLEIDMLVVMVFVLKTSDRFHLRDYLFQDFNLAS